MAPLLRFFSSSSPCDNTGSSSDSCGACSSSSSSSVSSTVSFNDRVAVKKIRHINDYSKKEISACWYNRQDFENMRSRHKKMQRYLQKRLNALTSSKHQREVSNNCSSKSLPEQIVIDNRAPGAAYESMTPQAQEERTVTQNNDIETLVSTTDANLKELQIYRDDLLRRMSGEMEPSDKQAIVHLLYSTRLHIKTLQGHRDTLLNYRPQ